MKLKYCIDHSKFLVLSNVELLVLRYCLNGFLISFLKICRVKLIGENNMWAMNNEILFSIIGILFFTGYFNTVKAQDINSHLDSLALEKIIVEKYYIADSTDYGDTIHGILPKGSITYRIYVDMKPDYKLQVVYGDEKHELFIKTSTRFFNNTECSAYTGFNIDPKKINENTNALDSWITMGAASKLHTGILKSDDNNGSILTRNTLNQSDGFTKGVFPNFKIFNLDLNFFNNTKDAVLFSTNNGAWAALGGVNGPTAENRVLIAQLTTDGKLSFNISVQIGKPNGDIIQFVSNDPEKNEIKFDGLSYE